MLQAFTTKPVDLLYHLANHSKILQRKEGEDRQKQWRDNVRQTVMKNCFVVKNIVDRFNKCEGNSRAARDARCMALSELACGMPYNMIVSDSITSPTYFPMHSIHTFIQIQLTHTQLSLQLRLPDAGQYKNRKITRQMYFAARNHAAAYGPGRPAFHIEHTRKVSISSHSLDLALQWIMDSNNIQKVCERVTFQLTSRLMHAISFIILCVHV